MNRISRTLVIGLLTSVGAVGAIAAAGKGGFGGFGHFDRLKSLDQNRDGAVTPEEYAKGQQLKFMERDANKDGVLDAQEIAAVKAGRGRGGDKAERLMTRFDANKDGRVTREEFEQGQRATFAKRDKNADGKLSADEAPRWFKGRRAGNGPETTTFEGMLQKGADRFARLDANRDGSIEAGEIAAMEAERHDNQIKKAMHRFDANRDGKVTPEEYMAPARQRFSMLDLDDNGRITAEDLPPDVRGQWKAP